MRTYFRSIAKPVVFLLMVVFLSMGMAMAAYICPQPLAPVAVAMEMPEGVPCPEMDKEQPVLCAQSQAGDDVALELPSALSVTAPTPGFIAPAPVLLIPEVIAHVASSAPSAPESPPYLHTRRLRI